MDVLVAIDALDDLVHNGKPTFLGTDRKVDAAAYAAAVERIATTAAEVADDPRLTEPIGTLQGLSAPGRSRLRIDPEVVYDVLDHLRLAVVEVISELRPPSGRPLDPAALAVLAPATAAVDAIETLVREGRPVPLSLRRHVATDALREAIAQLDAAVATVFDLLERGRLAPRVDVLRALLEGRTVGNRLLLDPEPAYDALDLLRYELGGIVDDRR